MKWYQTLHFIFNTLKGSLIRSSADTAFYLFNVYKCILGHILEAYPRFG